MRYEHLFIFGGVWYRGMVVYHLLLAAYHFVCVYESNPR